MESRSVSRSSKGGSFLHLTASPNFKPQQQHQNGRGSSAMGFNKNSPRSLNNSALVLGGVIFVRYKDRIRYVLNRIIEGFS